MRTIPSAWWWLAVRRIIVCLHNVLRGDKREPRAKTPTAKDGKVDLFGSDLLQQPSVREIPIILGKFLPGEN